MSRTVLSAVLALALTALILVAMQCDGGAAPVSTLPPGATSPPAQSPASPGSAYPAATGEPTQPTPTEKPGAYPAPPPDVEKLLAERCGATCHNLDRVKSAKKTEAEWRTTVDRMIAKGAKLTAEEAAALVRFLAKVYQ